MRILWASHSAHLRGGAEFSLIESVTGLLGLGHDVHVVAPAEGELTACARSRGASTSIVPYGWWMTKPGRAQRTRRTARSVRTAIAQLAPLIEREHPDVVVSNTLSIVAPALAAWWAGAPHVWYLHEFGSDDHGVSFDLGEPASCLAIGLLSRCVIVNSQSMFDKFKRTIPIRKLRVVPHAVSIAGTYERTIAPDSCLRVVLVGQVVPTKGQEQAVRAVALLNQRGYQVDLTLVGKRDAAYASYLTALAKEASIEDRVHFIDFTNAPLQHVVDADLALMCSRKEAFGRVTIEAMKMGRAVIGARSGATAELVSDGLTGLLYEPGNHTDLADKIQSLHDDRRRCAVMGSEARRWALERFGLDQHMSALLPVLEQATNLKAACA